MPPRPLPGRPGSRSVTRTPPPPSLRAVPAMLLGVFLLTVMDAVAKATLERGVPLAEMMFIRSVLICAGLQLVLRARGELHRLAVVDRRGQLLRGALGAAAPLLFFAALARMPLTAATVVGYGATFSTVLLSVWLLGERVGPRRWAGIVVGYAGVLVAVGPARDGPVSGYVLVLLASLAISGFYVAGKRLAATESALSLVNGYNAVLGLACLAALPFVWRAPDATSLALIGAFALLAVAGQWLLTRAYAVGDASLVAPLEYTSLVWVVALDVAVWGIVPAGHTLAGAGIIVAASLFVLYRERRAALADSRP